MIFNCPGNDKEINKVLETANKMRILKSDETIELCQVDMCENSLDLCADSRILLQLPDESVCHLYTDGSFYPDPSTTHPGEQLERPSVLPHPNPTRHRSLSSFSASTSATTPSTSNKLTSIRWYLRTCFSSPDQYLCSVHPSCIFIQIVNLSVLCCRDNHTHAIQD